MTLARAYPGGKWKYHTRAACPAGEAAEFEGSGGGRERSWHDRNAALRANRPFEQPGDLRVGGARLGEPGARRRCPAAAPRARREPHRHRRRVRRRGAEARTLARRAPREVLHRDQDRRPQRRRSAPEPRTLTGAPRGRPRRPHTAPQPGGGGRVGDRARALGRPRSSRPSRATKVSRPSSG